MPVAGGLVDHAIGLPIGMWIPGSPGTSVTTPSHASISGSTSSPHAASSARISARFTAPSFAYPAGLRRANGLERALGEPAAEHGELGGGQLLVDDREQLVALVLRLVGEQVGERGEPLIEPAIHR